MAFLPELILAAGALLLFVISLGEGQVKQARAAALGTALIALVACALCLGEHAVLFDGAYRVDAFSQWLKLVFAFCFFLVLLLSGDLPDIQIDVKPEYFLFLTVSILGL